MANELSGLNTILSEIASLKANYSNTEKALDGFKKQLSEFQRDIFDKLDFYVSKEVLELKIMALKEKDEDQQKQLKDLYGKSKWHQRTLIGSLLSLVIGLIIIFIQMKQ